MWFVVFTVGSALLVRDPNSSLGFILIGVAFLLTIPSSELLRRPSPREVMLSLLGPVLLVGAAVTLSLVAPSWTPSTPSPQLRPSIFRIVWAVVWAAIVVLELRRALRKAPVAA
jgi:hypothetical protein